MMQEAVSRHSGAGAQVSSLGAAHEAHERNRLIGVMNRYLDALTARDVRKVPLGASVRCTENGCELALGAGLWRTIRGRRPRTQCFVDVSAGQVEAWGIADEMGKELIFGVRLRVEGRLISEIETAVVRVGPSDVNPVDLDVFDRSPDSIHEVLPPQDRVSREQLVRVANLYFDAIEQSDGSHLPVSDGCTRYVNGIIDSVMDQTDLDKLDKNQAHRGHKVAAQMSAGDYAYIEHLRGRRYPIVDEFRGLVLAHVMFDHPGDLTRASGENPMPSPNCLLAFEVFKVRKGVLTDVWAIGPILPYGMKTGW